jgi:hypothetical protein
MANSRVETLAEELVRYLKQLTPSEFANILNTVKKNYANTWLSSWFYKRDRTELLDDTIDTLEENQMTVCEAIIQILNKGGREESSANTILLRALLEQSSKTKNETKLSLTELIMLSALVLEHISKDIKQTRMLDLAAKNIELKKINMEEQKKNQALLAIKAITKLEIDELLAKKNIINHINQQLPFGVLTAEFLNFIPSADLEDLSKSQMMEIGKKARLNVQQATDQFCGEYRLFKNNLTNVETAPQKNNENLRQKIS